MCRGAALTAAAIVFVFGGSACASVKSDMPPPGYTSIPAAETGKHTRGDHDGDGRRRISEYHYWRVSPACSIIGPSRSAKASAPRPRVGRAGRSPSRTSPSSERSAPGRFRTKRRSRRAQPSSRSSRWRSPSYSSASRGAPQRAAGIGAWAAKIRERGARHALAAKAIRLDRAVRPSRRRRVGPQTQSR